MFFFQCIKIGTMLVIFLLYIMKYLRTQVFLGQKYGYRPIPTYVLSSELEMLRTELEGQGMDVSLLDKWYKKDSNAVPPTSILQPISSILKNFNNKVINFQLHLIMIFIQYSAS